MTTANASFPLQVLCQFMVSVAPSFDFENIVLPVQPLILPDGYVSYPDIGVAYKIFTEKVTWTEARERCHREGTRLAIIDSQKKVECASNQTHSTTGQVHVGIYRMADKWVGVGTGESLSNVPWIQLFDYPRSGDNCAALNRIGRSSRKGIWAHDCSFHQHYICEIPIPEIYKARDNQLAQIPVN